MAKIQKVHKPWELIGLAPMALRRGLEFSFYLTKWFPNKSALYRRLFFGHSHIASSSLVPRNHGLPCYDLVAAAFATCGFSRGLKATIEPVP